MLRKLFAGVAAAVAAVVLMAAPAWAGACENVSRTEHAPADADGTMKGRWIYSDFDELDEPVWGFVAPGTFGTPGNFQNGAGSALLDNSAACGNGDRTATEGIQTHGC